jgi:molecular chaperone Hsp33
MILMDTASENELLDPGLHSNNLLFRLFHEEGVIVFEPKKAQKNCRCDSEKVISVLQTMSDDDLAYVIKEGAISVKCEFCSKEYNFDPKQILKTKPPESP